MRKPDDSVLKLFAEDAEDLAVLSAHLQDAILRVGDIIYLPKARRLALTLNRFCWERPAEKLDGRDVYRRINCGVHFDGVTAVQAKGIDRANPEGLIYLLAVKFEPGPKGGTIALEFAGGATLRAKVEGVEASVRDFGAGWLTESKPRHDEIAGTR